MRASGFGVARVDGILMNVLVVEITQQHRHQMQDTIRHSVELFECILLVLGCAGMGLTSSKDRAGWRTSRHGIGRWQGRGGMEGIASGHASMELANVTTGRDGGHQGISAWKLESTSGRDKRTR